MIQFGYAGAESRPFLAISLIKILDQNYPACKCFRYSMESFSPDQASLLVSNNVCCSHILSLIPIHMYLHVHIILIFIIILLA